MSTVLLIILSYDSVWRAQYQRRHGIFSKLVIALWQVDFPGASPCRNASAAVPEQSKKYVIFVDLIFLHRWWKVPWKSLFNCLMPCPFEVCIVIFRYLKEYILWQYNTGMTHFHITRVNNLRLCWEYNSTEGRKTWASLYCRTLFPMVWETYSFQCWLHIMGVDGGTFKSKVTKIILFGDGCEDA